MNTTFSTTSTNRHIESLEALFAESNRTIEWLVIAHNDARMVRSLSQALSGEAAAVLEVSEDTWDFNGQELPETIEWALQRGKIKHLVLVGNSQAGGLTSRASLAPSKDATEDAPQSSNERLLAGVNRTNALNRQAQERFASQVRQMSQIPVVHNRWTESELAVYGLFYRAESGLFLAYDAENDSFRPLM